MSFEIYFGIPEVRDFWLEISKKVEDNTATKDETKFYKKFIKAVTLLKNNPHHNGLKTHEIEILSRKYGRKVWQSYLENKKPVAGRLFWVYYPPGAITIIGIEPHPNDNKHSYEKITLSSTTD